MEIQRLVEQYLISPEFLANYFYKNARERYNTQLQECMFWRRGAFLPPHKKEQYIQNFVKDEIVDYYENQIFRIHSVQFAVTTRCTLRCRDCSVMIPRFAHGPHIDLTFDKFKGIFDRLTDSVDFMRTVLFLGGEPLLNDDLPLMLAYAAGNPKVGLVDIVTNCTIIPSPRLIDAARKYNGKVFFGLSNYSSNGELAPRLKRAEIIRLLKENNIAFTLDTGDVEWFHYELRECSRGDAEAGKLFASCQWRYCLYFLDGLLGICPRSLAGRALGAFKLPADEMINFNEGGISGGDTRQALIAFYKKNFLSACRYCFRHEQKVKPAIQGKEK